MTRYYRIAIIGHAQFRKDDPVAQTYLALKAAGHGVELIDPAYIPDALAEDGSANTEALGAFIERFAPHYIACRGESADAILEACRRTGDGEKDPIRHVVVFGYIGPDNFGDELIFSIISRAIEKRYPGSYVSVIGHKPERTLARHGVVSVTPIMKAEAYALLGGASALVFMAGIMFDFPFEDWTAGPIDLYLNPHSEIAGQTAFALMAFQNDVPCVYLGIGAGPLANPDAQKLVKIASLARPVYLPRDENTSQLLLDAGVDPELVTLAADLAFTLERPSSTADAKAWLAEAGLATNDAQTPFVSAAFRDHRTCGDELFDAMAAVFDHLFESRGWHTVFFDFAPEDHAVHQRIARAMKHPEAARFFEGTTDERLTLELLSCARASVAMRLHCSIVSNAFGIPSLGVNYNDKVEELYRRTDAQGFLLPTNCTADEALCAIERLIEDDGGNARVHARVRELRAQAKGALDALFALIESSDAPACPQRLYSRCVSPEREQLDAAMERIAQLERTIEEMRASTTWKAGSAITALPRALRDASARRA